MGQTPLGWEGGLGSREAPGGRSPSASPPRPAAQPMESPSKRVGGGGGTESVPDDRGPGPRPLVSSPSQMVYQLQALTPLPALAPSSQEW